MPTSEELLEQLYGLGDIAEIRESGSEEEFIEIMNVKKYEEWFHKLEAMIKKVK